MNEQYNGIMISASQGGKCGVFCLHWCKNYKHATRENTR